MKTYTKFEVQAKLIAYKAKYFPVTSYKSHTAAQRAVRRTSKQPPPHAYSYRIIKWTGEEVSK